MSGYNYVGWHIIIWCDMALVGSLEIFSEEISIQFGILWFLNLTI